MKFFQFLSLAFIYIFTPFVVSADSANISGLVFTTDARAVAISTISDAITVTTQNSSGGAEKVDETNDVTFISTSGTGEFLGSSGNPVTTTMARNTSSRTFYYRDSTAGTPSLTITVKGRDTGKTFSATQNITVGQVMGGGTGGTSTTTGSTSGGNSGIVSGSGSSSTHSSQTSLSSVKEDLPFEVSAGRKRIVSVNTPIEFKAMTSGKEGVGNTSYLWSFGDGKETSGKNVSHTYRYTGEYNVVLNFENNEAGAVSRTEVKVVEPKISIGEVQSGKGGYVEIENQSSDEVNIGGYIIEASSTSIFLPKDTIFKPKSKIRLPVEFLNDGIVSLYYPNKVLLVSYANNLAQNIDRERMIGLLESQLAVLQSELLSMQSYGVGGDETLAIKTPVYTPTVSNTVPTSTPTSPQTASLVNALETHKDNQSIFSGSINFIKKIFAR